MSRFKFALIVPFVLALVLAAACNGTGAGSDNPNVLFSTLVEDADGDGVADEQDGCPEDPAKSEPGQCGCGELDTDSDQDGVANCNDECPSNELKTVAGECGCSEADDDTDEDGTPDCVDECPNNAEKTEAGDCGCTAVDTDSDEDGTADCVDGCPDDANKTSPGVCGCGESDADEDDDGTPDCNDGCPSDPFKTAPGECGCGFGEAALGGGEGAPITFVVNFNDPDSQFTEYYEDIERTLVQASNDWAAYLSAPTPVSIEIELSFINHEVAAATAASMTSVFVRDNGDFLVFEQGVASEIRTGVDPNGDTADAQVNLDIDTLINNYWFDPDPAARTEPVPQCEFNGGWQCYLDAYSILAHEMGHAFAYNGLRNAETGEIGEFGSTFDDQIEVVSGSMFFVGTEAVAVHGSNVPLADPAHLDLVTLMNPIIDWGVRNSISDLDIAILDDVGLPMAGTSSECTPSTPSVRSIQPTILGPKPEPRGCMNPNCPHNLKARLKMPK